MARTRWPSDLGTPASSPGRADQTGSAGGCHKNLGPGRQIVSQDSTSASAESEVRPGPRTLTLRPRQIKAREAGPEALPTLSLPNLAQVLSCGLRWPASRRSANSVCAGALSVCEPADVKARVIDDGVYRPG